MTPLRLAPLLICMALGAQSPEKPAPPMPPARPSVQPVAPAPRLHLEGRIVDLACEHALQFEITVQNLSNVACPGPLTVRVDGAALADEARGTTGSIEGQIGGLPANGSEVLLLAPASLKVDCHARQTFVVTLRAGANLVGPHPNWDKDALELETTPPANCAAALATRRRPNWSGKL